MSKERTITRSITETKVTFYAMRIVDNVPTVFQSIATLYIDDCTDVQLMNRLTEHCDEKLENCKPVSIVSVEKFSGLYEIPERLIVEYGTYIGASRK